MLKVISTSVLFGLLGTTFPTLAEESRPTSNRTMTDERSAVAKPYTRQNTPSQTRNQANQHANKHSNAPRQKALKHTHSYPPTYSQNPYQSQVNHHTNHYPMTSYQQAHRNQFMPYAHHDGVHYQTAFNAQPYLKRHALLPKHLAYSRVPTRIENKLGYLPNHLMRVRVGNDIAVIHIKNRIVHEIIRGLF